MSRKAALPLLVVCTAAALAGSAVGAVDIDGTWRPNYRIGPVEFNKELPDGVQVISRDSDGWFVVRLANRAIVRGLLSADPNTNAPGIRYLYTRSRRLQYRGVRVGSSLRTARRQLGKRFKLQRIGRRGRKPYCRFFNAYSLDGDPTGGPVSTQVWIDRTNRVWRISLDEITEIGCPSSR